METKNYNTKSLYEALLPRKLGVLKDSVSYELWVPKSAELVEEYTDVPCFVELSKMPFWEMLG